MVELPLRPGPAGAARGPDVLALPGVRRFLRWRHARFALQLPLLLLAAFVIVDGLTGRQLAPRNVATTAVWLHYRGLVVLALLLVGNLFCAACPLMLTRAPARWAQRAWGRSWRWPAWLRSKALVLVLMGLFVYAYEAFALWSSPWLTAWLAIGYFGAAWVVDTLFPAGTFCRYVCPLGNFNFALAIASPTQIGTVDPAVCDRCVGKPCLHGRVTDARDRAAAWHADDGSLRDARDGPRRATYVALEEVVAPNGVGRFPGCETGLFVPRVSSNLDCTLCFNCLRACPYDNVALRLRAPWHELVRDGLRHRGRRVALLLGTLLAWWGLMNAVAMVPPYFDAAEAVAHALGTRAAWLVLAVLLGGATVVGLALTLAAATLADLAGGRREGAWAAFDRWGYVVLVLAVGFWTAHYLFHFLTGALAIVPVFQHFLAFRGFDVDPAWRLAQLVPSRWLFPIGAGIVSGAAAVALVVTVRIALRDFGRRGVGPIWVVGAFVVAVVVVQVLVLGLPMEMRGTLLGPLPVAP